jgi:hypothetical protein
LASPNKNETQCSEHCVCFQTIYDEKKCVRFEKDILDFWEKTNQDLIKKFKLRLTLNMFSGIGKKKGKVIYGFSLNPISAPVDVGSYYEAFSRLNKVYDLLKSYDLVLEDGTSCTTLIFSKEIYKLVGEINLPTNFHLRSDLRKKIGKSQLTGFEIALSNSPVGLRFIEISARLRGRSKIRLSHSFKPSREKDMFRLTLNKSRELTELFVVKI